MFRPQRWESSVALTDPRDPRSMARPLRIEFPGALYHVTSRGNERRPIFRTNRDRNAFLEFLGAATRRFGWSVAAYVLMTNHFHLVLQTPDPNLSRGMQWLNGKYAGWFNRRHKRSGHLFQGRFHSLLIDKEAYLAEVLRYVVLNPVRAAMVAQPGDYRWSSYRATAGLEEAPAWLDRDAALAMFGPDDARAQNEYRRFVQAKVGCDERLWDKVDNGIYLGSGEWLKNMRKVVESKPRSTDHPRLQRAAGRPTMAEVIDAIGRAAEAAPAEVRRRQGGALRRLAAWLGWNEGWLTLRSIAASLRLRSEGHISNLIRRCERELGCDRTLLGWLDASLAMLRV